MTSVLVMRPNLIDSLMDLDTEGVWYASELCGGTQQKSPPVSREASRFIALLTTSDAVDVLSKRSL